MVLGKPIQNFLDDLASKAPTPGGGSVAALSGATACALVSMVCNVSNKNKNDEVVKRKLENILSESERLRELFQELIEQDIEAFSDVMSSMKMPKDSDEEKTIRHEALQHALQKAAYVPLRTMEHAGEILVLAHKAAQIGSKYVISDAGVAAIMAESALQSAWFNVAINLESIEDQEFIDRIANKAEKIIDDIEGIADEIIEIVEDVIYSE